MTWASDVSAGDWIGPRLGPFASGVADSVVPRGFARYVRVLHPAGGYGDDPGVPWALVAAWSGVPLRPDSTWLDIAVPPDPRPDPLPWDGSGPWTGEYPRAVSAALVDVLDAHTDPAAGAWAATWEGFGDLDPLPDGPRFRLPYRDYLLRHGSVRDTAWLAADPPWPGHPPSLWWDADRSWCVATEVDLDQTFVGGSEALVEELLRAPGLEAQPIDGGRHRISWREPAALADTVAAAVRTVLAAGEATLTLSRGTVTVALRRPRLRVGTVDTASIDGRGGSATSSTVLSRGDDVATVVRQCLLSAVTGLVS